MNKSYLRLTNWHPNTTDIYPTERRQVLTLGYTTKTQCGYRILLRSYELIQDSPKVALMCILLGRAALDHGTESRVLAEHAAHACKYISKLAVQVM
jgi:hypothetical protein